MVNIINYPREHPARFTIMVLVVVAVSTLAFFIITAGKVRTTINVVPGDAKLLINGEQKQGGIHYLTPGEYQIVASKDGYSKYERKVFVKKEMSEVLIPVSLVPSSSEAEREADRNSGAYKKNEGLGSRQAQADGRFFRDRNPIVSKLPFRNFFYTIGYRKDNSDPTGLSIIIEIYAREGNKSNAVSQIERWGYDPTELNIQFRGESNPFDERTQG